MPYNEALNLANSIFGYCMSNNNLSDSGADAIASYPQNTEYGTGVSGRECRSRRARRRRSQRVVRRKSRRRVTGDCDRRTR